MSEKLRYGIGVSGETCPTDGCEEKLLTRNHVVLHGKPTTIGYFCLADENHVPKDWRPKA